MATLNLNRLETEFGNRWVVLNREWKVVDSNMELSVLRARTARDRCCTFYFVSV